MRSLDGLSVVMVTSGATWAARHCDTLRARGAKVTSCEATDLLVLLGDSPTDLVILADTGDELAPPVLIRRLLASELAAVPLLLVLVPEEDTQVMGLLTRLGMASILPALVEEDRLCEAAWALGSVARRARELELRARQLEEEVRDRSRRVDEMRQKLDSLEHDLRMPLGVVVGVASNLRDGIMGPLTEAQREQADRVVRAALRAGPLLDQVREISRHAASEPLRPSASPLTGRRLQRTLLELCTLAEEIVALFQENAGSRGIALTFSRDGPVHVWGDPVRIGQAVTNLCANAIKFTPGGGSVTVAVRLAKAEDPGKRSHAEVVVTDTGPGIPAEERERIFERGYRMQRDSAVPGRGIGLAVARETAELHRGNVSACEAPGGGARFVLSLPLDLRTRPDAGVMIVRESDAVDELVEALCMIDMGKLAVSPVQAEAFLRAATALDAVIVVPRDGRESALMAALRKIGQG
ncbi:MAG: HAMP domain-containing histidine kinase [Deltaproteobacteria bacterium]|nr:HAMP domain-containing histidine kinase [Deltaproteobacteria bacterium]